MLLGIILKANKHMNCSVLSGESKILKYQARVNPACVEASPSRNTKEWNALQDMDKNRIYKIFV